MTNLHCPYSTVIYRFHLHTNSFENAFFIMFKYAAVLILVLPVFAMPDLRTYNTGFLHKRFTDDSNTCGSTNGFTYVAENTEGGGCCSAYGYCGMCNSIM